MKSPCLKKKRGKKREGEGDTPMSPPPPSFCAQWHANDSPVTAQLGPGRKGWGLELLKAPRNYCQSELSFCSSPLLGEAALSRSPLRIRVQLRQQDRAVPVDGSVGISLPLLCPPPSFLRQRCQSSCRDLPYYWALTCAISV